MKLVIFGATGETGMQLVEQGLAAGHTITVMARTPQTVTQRHARLKVLQGDILNANDVSAAIQGQDAILSSIGVRTLDPTTVFSVGTDHMLKAMKQHGVRRIMVISAAPLEIGATIPLWQKIMIPLVLRPILRHAYADARLMEETLFASNTDWTIMRAPRLTNGERTGKYTIAYDAHLSQAGIRRADLADYMLTHVNNPVSYRKKVEMAY